MSAKRTSTASCVGGFLFWATVSVATAQSVPWSPAVMAAASDGKVLYVACATANRILGFDVAQRKVAGALDMPGPPSGLALSPDDQRLYITCASPESLVVMVEARSVLNPGGDALARVRAGRRETIYLRR